MKLRFALVLLAAACLGTLECAAADSDPVATAGQALRDKLQQKYPNVTRWQIDLLPSAAPGAGGASAAHTNVTVTRLGARSAVWIGSQDLGARRNGTLLWFDVAGYAPAVTATHALTAGAPLDPRDGIVLERDIIGSDCVAIEDSAALAGMRVKRLVRAGETICTNVLEAAPAVARGEEVTLFYSGRSFTLTARGVAQGDGALGRQVTVRNSSSGEILTATVTGKGEVSVHE